MIIIILIILIYIANVVFGVIDVVEIIMCATSPSLLDFFNSQEFEIITLVEAVRNVVYSIFLSYYGVKLVTRLYYCIIIVVVIIIVVCYCCCWWWWFVLLLLLLLLILLLRFVIAIVMDPTFLSFVLLLY